MDCPRFPRLPHLRRWRWLAFSLCAAGCTHPMAEYESYGPTASPERSQSASEIARVGHTVEGPAELPPAAQGPHEVPITLDTVLRLAEQHNARIGLAREKLNESELSSEAAGSWLPKTYAGVAYYRHEGGIQNFDGTLIHSSTGALFPGVQLQSELDLREAAFQRVSAERQIWQSKGELSQVSNEVLVEAASAYVDLLTAQRGEALMNELEKYERKLLKRAEDVLADEPSAKVMVEGLRATLANRQVGTSRLRQQGNAASAKLVYLLGLPPDAQLVSLDRALAPIELVDPTPPTLELVALALSSGPGVRELEAILTVIQGGIDQASGPMRLLPNFQANVYEGAFGAGPGDAMRWDNRLDVCVQARWDLTQLVTARTRKRLAESKLQQAHLNYDDLRGKLTAGVQESRDAILKTREQINHAAEQVRAASENYRLSDLRLAKGAMGANTSEVLAAIRGLEQAHFNYVQSINTHNKAQVRLLLLLGQPTATGACHP